MSLHRRVDALEEIAEREAWARGLDADDVLRHVRAARAETARLRAAGCTDDEIVAVKARRLGIAPADLLARADRLLG